MTEEKNTEQQDPNKAVFMTIGQYARDISVECLKPAFTPGAEQLSVNMDVSVSARKLEEEYQHETALKLKAQATDEQGDIRYIVEVDYTGVFHAENVPQEQLTMVLSVDGAAMLFPFVRQIVMEQVTNAGYRPGMIEPINFHALFTQAQKSVVDEQERVAQKAAEEEVAKIV